MNFIFIYKYLFIFLHHNLFLFIGQLISVLLILVKLLTITV